MTALTKLYDEYARHEFDPPSSGAGDIAVFARRFEAALKEDCRNAGLDVISVDYNEDVDISAFVLNRTTDNLAYVEIFSMSGHASYPLERVLCKKVESLEKSYGGENHYVWLTKLIETVKKMTA